MKISTWVYPTQELNYQEKKELNIFIGNSLDLKNKYEICKSMLPEQELQRSNKFVRNIDAKTYVYTHYHLRDLLADQLNIPFDMVSIKNEYMAKPKLNNEQLDFNVSHSNNFFALIIADSCNLHVGIDIELNNKEVNLTQITENHMHSDESHYINKPDDKAQKKERFMEIWTKKEAFLKMTGIGIINDLPLINVAQGHRIININNSKQINHKITEAHIYTYKNREFTLSCSLSEQRKLVIRNLK